MSDESRAEKNLMQFASLVRKTVLKESVGRSF